jgi:hypothetical protein
MSAFKKLNKQDSYVTTYVAHKQWSIPGSEVIDTGLPPKNNTPEYGIGVFIATGKYFNSIKQLYYPDKENNNVLPHSYNYSPQTTLHFPESRNLISGSFILSIPSKLYGSYINPKEGFKLSALTGNSTYVNPFYWETGYAQDALGTGLEEYGAVVEILDDGEGNLYVHTGSGKKYVGDIIYSQGIIVVTDLPLANLLQSPLVDPVTGFIFLDSTTILSLEFQSSKEIYTHNFHCKVREFESNYTNNPTAFKYKTEETYYNDGTPYTGLGVVRTGELKDTLTGSEFSPYITAVGLYNDVNELIAVGKLTLPVPKSQFTEMTFKIKLDI